MLTDHYRLACDEPGCKAAVLSRPLDFGGSEAALRRFYRDAGELGWARIEPELDEAGNPRPALHYCPRHTGADRGTLIF